MADTAMEAKETPLQEKLEVMATRIGYFGFTFAILTFIAMILSWYIDNTKLKKDFSNESSWIIHAVITSVTIVVVAIPEGLVGVCSLSSCPMACAGAVLCMRLRVRAVLGRHFANPHPVRSCTFLLAAPCCYHFLGVFHSEDVEGPKSHPCACGMRDYGQRH